MVTTLHGSLRRELTIRGHAYVVTLDEDGIKLTLKGHRKGQQLRWNDLVSGDAALAVALNASLAQAGRQAPAARAIAARANKARKSRRH
jgi:hypothetical protein